MAEVIAGLVGQIREFEPKQAALIEKLRVQRKRIQKQAARFEATKEKAAVLRAADAGKAEVRPRRAEMPLANS